MSEQIVIRSLSEIDAAAEEFLRRTASCPLVAFDAAMGAGKTTFITALCRCLGVRSDAVSSPTFAIVNEYRTATGEPVYHFDFYRINKLEEALDIGLYDYLDSGARCWMEWAENIEALLPEETLRVRISVAPDGTRTLSWQQREA